MIEKELMGVKKKDEFHITKEVEYAGGTLVLNIEYHNTSFESRKAIEETVDNFLDIVARMFRENIGIREENIGHFIPKC